MTLKELPMTPRISGKPRKATKAEREGSGWTQQDFINWVNSLPVPVGVRNHQPYVCKLLAMEEAMYFNMRSGRRPVSERTQRMCDLLSVLFQVAFGNVGEETIRKAKELTYLDLLLRAVYAEFPEARSPEELEQMRTERAQKTLGQQSHVSSIRQASAA